jgi:hypothetical protein
MKPYDTLKNKIIYTIWGDKPDTSELFGALAKILFGISVLHAQLLFFQLGELDAHQQWQLNLVLASISILLGTIKLSAWLMGSVQLRRTVAFIGVMLWLFFSTINSMQGDRIVTMYMFLLFSFSDMLIYLRLRYVNGTRSTNK